MSFSRQVFLLCLVLAGILILQAQVIELPGLGLINGTTAKSHWTARTIYQYKGIPFAEPPIGELRWKPPVKYATPWVGVRAFTDFGFVCPQGAGFMSDLNLPTPKPRADEQSEDCLTINVFTNKIEGGGATGRPVMVYFHGGALISGSARGHDPIYLLEKDVVLATVQYRLGPLGFLSLKTPEIPGNQGMLDTVLALEWVRDNIEHFGGDPSRVTIFGQSAGAAVVTALLFSPKSAGLFHGVIAHSGSLFGTWALDADPVPHGKAIATLAGCIIEATLVDCMRRKSADQILRAHAAFLAQDVLAGGRALGGHHIVWNEAGADSFMRDDPAKLLINGNFHRMPMIAGTTKNEATGFFGIGYDLIIKPFNLDTNVEYMKRKAVKQILDYGGIVDQTGYIRSFTRDQYFPSGELGNFTSMTPGMIDILGVSLLKACTITMAAEMNRYADTFFYSFNFYGRHTSFPTPNPYPFEGGINHSDDLYYLFHMGRELNSAEETMAQEMVELWTNFATNKVPSANGVAWPKMTSAEGPYLRFENNGHKIMEDYIAEEYMIAVKEGLSPPFPLPTDPTTVPTTPSTTADPGAAVSIQVSAITLITALLIHFY